MAPKIDSKSKDNDKIKFKPKRREYNSSDLIQAHKMVRTGTSIYKASKECNVPWSTLKRYVKENGEDKQIIIKKLGKPYALTSEMEVKFYNFIITMQEIGFGLTVLKIRQLAYKLAEKGGRAHHFNGPEGKNIASKMWWFRFKSRYGLTLRVAENLSAYRASCANRVLLNDFYEKFKSLSLRLGIFNNASRIWNVDETGLQFIINQSKVVTQIGKKYVYRRQYSEKGETHTLVGCACANGTWIPPMIIFKGVRWNDNLATDCLPNCQVKLSVKGWINSQLFEEWFDFFIVSIPPERPVILLMDSHGSHVTPEIIEKARVNEIYLVTFPSHTTHLLQPLDVGVYKSLKSNWSRRLSKFMDHNPTEKPSRYNFHSIFNVAFIESFSHSNITNAFKKTGILPFNESSIPDEAIAPSTITDQPSPASTPATPVACRPTNEGTDNQLPNQNSPRPTSPNLNEIDLLAIPSTSGYRPKTKRKRSNNQSPAAKILTPTITNESMRPVSKFGRLER